MKCFNEQFKQLLSLYPNDQDCIRAKRFIEQSDNLSSAQPAVSSAPNSPPTQPAKSDVWDTDRVKKFVAGLRFQVKKRNPYFGFLLDSVKIIVVNPDSKNFRTMAVDGKGNLYINPKFAGSLISGTEQAVFDQNTIDIVKSKQDPNIVSEVDYDSLKPGEKVFMGIIAHELMHIYKNHVERMGDRKKLIELGPGNVCTLWNIAADIEINDELLYTWGYHLVKNGIITNPKGEFEMNGKTYQCRGLSPERIYRMLLADIPPPAPPEIKVGSIVYDKASKKYGEVISINKKGEAKIGELTKAEAKKRAATS